MTTSTFNTLGLSKPSLEAIENLGFTEPTPVQALSIPPGIEGKDILAAAQTGTGKTLAYLLPIFDQMVRHFGSRRPKKGPYALVLAPTRELAQQISECASTIAQTTKFRTLTVIGGKTGTTEAAGSCLVLYSENQDKKPYISIVLKGNSKKELYTLMTELLTNYSN